MAPFDDVNLDRTEGWSEPPPGRHRPIVVVVVVALAIAAAVTAWWLMRSPEAPGAAEKGAPSPVASAPALDSNATRPSSLPPLDELDPSVRDLVRSLTGSALIERWLATSNLARQVAAFTQGAASGRTPLRFLAPLRPGGTFEVRERQGQTTIAPASHARFDPLTGVITALDPSAVARAYQTLAPRLEDAHDELGVPETSFDASFRRVLSELVATPIPNGPIAVVPRGGVYAFADPALESLSPVQKLLLRSGPDNARKIQSQLRALQGAIDVPPPTT